jgi:hypothetical protein
VSLEGVGLTTQGKRYGIETALTGASKFPGRIQAQQA